MPFSWLRMLPWTIEATTNAPDATRPMIILMKKLSAIPQSFVLRVRFSWEFEFILIITCFNPVFIFFLGKFAALWPFLGICAEVLILCLIILIYEKRRNKSELEESDTDPQEQ